MSIEEDYLSDFDKYRKTENGSFSNMDEEEEPQDEVEEEETPEEEDKVGLKEMLKTEFPLSGGEPDITFFELEEKDEEEKEKEEQIFKKNLNTEFPLSGGETE